MPSGALLMLWIYVINVIFRDSYSPRQVCTYCYRRRKDNTSYIVNDTSYIEHIWEPRTDNCLICIHASRLGKEFGVRKRDPIRLERVSLLYNLQSSDILYSVSESSLRRSSRDISIFDIVFFDTPVVDTFICKLYSNIFEICSVKTD